MTQLSDDLRFQELPPDDIRERIRKSFDKIGWKYIFINETNWYNSTTRCKHNIYNIPIYASKDCSERPRLVTEVIVQERANNGAFGTTAEYVYNKDYVHNNIGRKYNPITNAHSGTSGFDYVPDYENPNIQYKIEFESFCNPITMHHFFITDLKDLTLLFKGQLMGQNKGSPLRGVDSAAGTYEDLILRAENGGAFIKRSAPIIQLLSRASLARLQETNSLAEILQKNSLFPQDNQVAFKLLSKDKYRIGTQEELEQAIKDKQVSAYYPVITGEMCKELLASIPRIDIDFGCFGLGSAGTGVLDLISRSNFFEKYLLVDFDRVEYKNLRNQWYTSREVSYNKAQASFSIFKTRLFGDRHAEILYKTTEFQDINFSMYNFKYVMSAFDSIDTRLAFLDKILEEKSSAKYLIDTRYDDLTASVFFINLEKEEEIEFYRKGLLADKEIFDKFEAEKYVKNEEEFITYLKNRDCFISDCSHCLELIESKIKREYPDTSIERLRCPRSTRSVVFECQSEECINHFKDLYRKFPLACNKFKMIEEESSCVRQNFMDIYHYASTFVFDAIRIIENGKDKPFTQVDVTTDPLPTSIILRR